MSCRSSRPASARRSATSAESRSSASMCVPPIRPRGPRPGDALGGRSTSWAPASGSVEDAAEHPPQTRRRGSIGDPEHDRRITSSVTACIREWIGNSLLGPGVDLARDDLVILPRRRASARRGRRGASACGARGVRRPPAAAPERGPRIGSRATLRPGGSPFSRPRYSARITSGCDTITSGVRKRRMSVTLKASRRERRRHESMNSMGRNSQLRVWTAGGADGPGGSFSSELTSRPAAGVLAGLLNV